MRKSYNVIIEGEKVATVYKARNFGDIIRIKNEWCCAFVTKVIGNDILCSWTRTAYK